MTEFNDERPIRRDDDTEAHRMRRGADAESTEGEDTEGHAVKWSRADAEQPEGDDTEGHAARSI